MAPTRTRSRLAFAFTGVAAVAAVAVAGLIALTGARAENPPAPAPAPANAGDEAPAAPPTTRAPTVKIVFKLIPPGNATVMWGKKRLGVIKPKATLVVPRPRDSGPLDVIFRSPGYLPVHTRAYTFTDSTVAVKMTPLDQKNTLYGYREEIPPDGGLPGSSGPDGGVPPAR